MNHGEITSIDLGIIGIYLVGMVLVGVLCSRKVRNSDDYYTAGRSFGPFVLMATVCATIIGGSGGPACLCGAVLEEGHQTGHHRRHAGGLYGMRGMEAGGHSPGAGAHRARCHRLRHRHRGGQPCHL